MKTAPTHKLHETDPSMSRRPEGHAALTPQEQANMILALLDDLCSPETIDELGDYLDHVGFDLLALRRPQDLPVAWLGYYRIRRGLYDVDRAFADLATYPPMAAEIARLRALQREV